MLQVRLHGVGKRLWQFVLLLFVALSQALLFDSGVFFVEAKR